MIPNVPIYLIRHGQTDWNAEGRFQGQHDIPLNDIGRRQADSNGQLLRSLIGASADDYAFVASPMQRTRETMEIVRRAMGLSPEAYATNDTLIELSFGDWEGHTLAELRQSSPDAVARRDADKWNFVPPGEKAESYEILSWRVSGWLQSVTAPTVCVTHGGVIRSILKLCAASGTIEASEADIRQDRILSLVDGALTWIAP
jgi:probable phosphoglycerate mutase